MSAEEFEQHRTGEVNPPQNLILTRLGASKHLTTLSQGEHNTDFPGTSWMERILLAKVWISQFCASKKIVERGQTMALSLAPHKRSVNC